MTESNETIGGVKAVLVFGREPSAQAVISRVIGRRLDSKGRERVRFSGTVQFSHAAKRHIRSTIVSIVERILSALQLPPYYFELSAVNLGAASSLDAGMSISGFSADVPIFLALLSAALQVPIADDFVTTGHIASSDGSVRAVKGLLAKVQAVQADGTINRFFYPDLELDQSLKVLSPAERQRGIAAVMGARDSLETRAVCGIDEVVRAVFTQENVVLASLREGFFRLCLPCESKDPVAITISFWAQDNGCRFWHALERGLFAGDSVRGRRLLDALMSFFIAKQIYGSGAGAKLLNLVRSLPPAVRRLKIEFPLADTALCLKLGSFAARADYEDVLMLLDAVHGKGIAIATFEYLSDQAPTESVSEVDCAAFDAVVAQINEQALAQRFGIPIDSARGSYTLGSSTVQSQEEFYEILKAFYIHSHRWLSGETGESLDADQVRSGTVELLERAFQDQGGSQAAYAMARDGTGGGMRSVLDALAEQYKRKRYADHVRAVFKDAISDMDWASRVQFMRAAMKRLEPLLPRGITDEPPERFARQPEIIIQSYVESWDTFSRLLRTL